jgi:hypothetical protein
VLDLDLRAGRLRRPARLPEPRREKTFDLPACGRPLQSGLDALPRDDRQRRRRGDPEALEQIGALLRIHAVELEGGVVAPALQDLRKKALHAAATAGRRRVEEDETGLDSRAIYGSGSPQADPAFATPIAASIAADSVRSSAKTRSSPVT